MSALSLTNTQPFHGWLWVNNDAVTHREDGPNCSQVKKPAKTCSHEQVFFVRTHD